MMISEEALARLLKYDFSKGHEDFKERLLARCLAIADGKEDPGDSDGAGSGSDGHPATEPAASILSLVEPDGACGTGDPELMELGDMELLAVAGGIGGAGETTSRGVRDGRTSERLVP